MMKLSVSHLVDIFIWERWMDESGLMKCKGMMVMARLLLGFVFVLGTGEGGEI
jgi:hypothetical protein